MKTKKEKWKLLQKAYASLDPEIPIAAEIFEALSYIGKYILEDQETIVVACPLGVSNWLNWHGFDISSYNVGCIVTLDDDKSTQMTNFRKGRALS